MILAQILTLKSYEISNLFSEIPILNDAAKIGNVEFLTLLTRSYPDLVHKSDSNNYTIFHLAVIYRQEKVFSLIHHTGAIKDILMLNIDNSGNNILHLAATLAPSSRLNSVSGAALQM
ncbi:ankyrin repeat-containing NPR4-like [Olea europaea subsp. europaea]|uniref:Ankyrin repeat-containing NPR4-like n=1 Tax=Olea europaea subsp. europaea TaxID=158383 RepID=A0A8S0RB82_OLEEU|nr:ankyrin repeat-containing NPR4-like [Olea europaea subsp. europaea]